MKKWIFAVLLLLTLCFAVSALAMMDENGNVIDWDWGNNNTNNTNNNYGVAGPTAVPNQHVHRWEKRQTVEATCGTDGKIVYYCAGCQTEKTEVLPATGKHSWGKWRTTKEATCEANGKKTRTCSVCKKTETATIKKLGHDVSEWTVTKEPTCKKAGSREGVCDRCGKKIKEVVHAVDHDYSDWVITTEPTDFSKGERTASCRFCKKTKKEKFYPDGTLAKDLNNDPAKVKELQAELKARGFFSGKLTSKFDAETVKGVKKAEKSFDLAQDGIAWPGFLRMLGLGGIGGDGITKDPSKFTLQLDVKQTSPKKTYYSLGDEITYSWELTNASTKSTSKNTVVYHYDGSKSSSKDKAIAKPGTLVAGASASGTYTYTVTKEDVLAGKFSHGFVASGKIGGKSAKSNSVLFVNAASAGMGGTGGWTPPAEESITILKTIKGGPDNGFYYLKGETIHFCIEVKNKSDKEVENVIVTDELLGSGWKKTIPALEAKKSVVYDADYKVKVSDLPKGEVLNTAVVSYIDNEKVKMSKDSVKTPVGMDWNGLYIYKTCINTPKNGKCFMPGETVEFEIKVMNPPSTKKTFTKLEIFDWMYSKKNPYKKLDKLAPGDSVTYLFKTTVTELQAKVGKLTNGVMVSYRDPKNKKLRSQSNECTVPCGYDVLVTKKEISTPKNGSYYVEGEEVRFEIEVKNNTIKAIQTMDIRDSLADMDENGYRTVQKGETLEAGGTYSIHFSYIVTKEDVDNTKVTNMASAWWTIDGDIFTETYSEPVSVPTAEVPRQRKQKPKNIDGDACIPSLSAVGDGVSQRNLTECLEHTETAKKAKKFISDGMYEEASALWDADIDELYQEWEDNTIGETKRIAENEQAAFTHQILALEASLKTVCSEEDVQAIMTEERTEKCVELCYELHTAPEERQDSMEGNHTALGNSTNNKLCNRVVTYTADGPVTLTDDRCESHTLTMQLTETLLETAADDDDREYAWERAQGNWVLELNLMYDEWYLSADDEQRALIVADRVAFDQLINARADSLTYLYPDDPAAAAEVLSNMIMHRTELICHVLHEAGVLKN